LKVTMMRAIRRASLALSGIGLAVLLGVAAPVHAHEHVRQVDESTGEVLPGMTLTWGSSFLRADAGAEGGYDFTVDVANHAGSAATVTIEGLTLVMTTPTPRGQAPDATGEAAGLPITVSPGETASFGVSGTYELVETDEGGKANLHFRARGHGQAGDEPFELGINAHFRAPGVAAE
jgi:hypothetical protein